MLYKIPDIVSYTPTFYWRVTWKLTANLSVGMYVQVYGYIERSYSQRQVLLSQFTNR